MFLYEVLPNSSVIVVIVIDWEHSKAIENATKNWSGAEPLSTLYVTDVCDSLAGKKFSQSYWSEAVEAEAELPWGPC